MKRLLLIALLTVGWSARAWASTDTFQGFCTVGNVRVALQGMQSTNPVQGSFPRCLVTVYLTGSTNLATIYADGNDSHLANPFTANIDGSWRFWANNTNGYDILLQGGTPPFSVPYTLVNVKAGAVVGQALPIPLSSILSPVAPSVINLENFNLLIFGSAASPVAGNGAAGAAAIQLIAGNGQPTTGTNGQTGGAGANIQISGGDGGSAPSGSTNGSGGNVFIEGGYTGTGGGSQGNHGTVYIQNNNTGATYIGGATVETVTSILPGGALNSPAITVASSRVCTAANPCPNTTPPAPGIAVSAGGTWGTSINPASLATWPPSGIGVSNGSGWGVSIDPNTVPRTNTANTFTLPQTFGAISAASGMIANSPICTEATGCETGPGPTYPPAGIGVSTGSAWSPTSIDPASVLRFAQLGSGVDLNTVTNCGDYFGDQFINAPPGFGGFGAAIVNICTGNPTYLVQYLYPMNDQSAKIYWRKQISGTWSTWTDSWQQIQFLDSGSSPQGEWVPGLYGNTSGINYSPCDVLHAWTGALNQFIGSAWCLGPNGNTELIAGPSAIGGETWLAGWHHLTDGSMWLQRFPGSASSPLTRMVEGISAGGVNYSPCLLLSSWTGNTNLLFHSALCNSVTGPAVLASPADPVGGEVWHVVASWPNTLVATKPGTIPSKTTILTQHRAGYCSAGDMWVDGDYIYGCGQKNKPKRAALEAFAGTNAVENAKPLKK